MSTRSLPHLPDVRRDERGVALPLALLGLVSVSILVTTAMVTSSTELAISSAHQDATRALYVAEGGLQAYVAENGTNLLTLAGSGPIQYTPPGGDADDAVIITVSRLGSQVVDNPTPGDSTLLVFSVSAQPLQGGQRMLTALVRQMQPPAAPANFGIGSAMTVAGDLTVAGNSFNVHGGGTYTCELPGGLALRAAADSELDLASNQYDNFDGVEVSYDTTSWDPLAVDTIQVEVEGEDAMLTEGTRQELASEILGGQTIDDLANRIEPDNWRYRTREPLYSEAVAQQALPLVDDGETPEVLVVDAEGGQISVGPGSYSGLLIVLNGSVRLHGNVDFRGVIIAERNFELDGSVSVAGAIVSLAMDGENVVSDSGDDTDINGSATVNFDQCLINSAENAYGQVAPNDQDPVLRETMAWFEVVG